MIASSTLLSIRIVNFPFPFTPFFVAINLDTKESSKSMHAQLNYHSVERSSKESVSCSLNTTFSIRLLHYQLRVRGPHVSSTTEIYGSTYPINKFEPTDIGLLRTWHGVRRNL